MGTAQESDRVDAAALYGAMLAAVIALTLGEGAWTWFSTALGVALLLLLVAFYRPTHRGQPVDHRRMLATAAAGALAATLLAAWPLQLVLEHWTSVGNECRQLGQVAALERDADLRQAQARPVPGQTLVPEAQLLTDDARALATKEAADRASANCLGRVTFDRLYWWTGLSFLVLWLLLAPASRKRARTPTTSDPPSGEVAAAPSADDAADDPIPSRDNLFLAYQTLAARRSAYDLMLWQTPALAIAAQAFLLTLALGPNSSDLARLTASALALALALMSMQLMAKHRYHEELDSRLLQRFEDDLGITRWLKASPHGQAEERALRDAKAKPPQLPWPRRIWGLSSYRVWVYGLAVFGLASVLVIVTVLTGRAAQLLQQ